jgi:GTP pyrophosphokinase
MLSKRFEEALVFAARTHSGQVRKGTSVPYVSHLLGVTGIALDYGADEDEAIAALLHDAVEDQGGLPILEEIRHCFGDRVAEIVDGCTDSYTTPKPPWMERKRAYLKRVHSASASVCLVSAADKLYNVQAILRGHRQLGDAVWKHFNAAPEEILWYYRSLVDAFQKISDGALIHELDLMVGQLESLIRSPGR